MNWKHWIVPVIVALMLAPLVAQTLSAHITSRVDIGSTGSASDRRVRFLTSTDSAEIRFDDTDNRFEPNYPFFFPAVGIYSDDTTDSCGTGQECGTIFDISGLDGSTRNSFAFYNSVSNLEFMRYSGNGFAAGLWVLEGGDSSGGGLGGTVSRVLTTFNPKFNFEITTDPTDQLCSAVGCQSGQACGRGDYALYKETNADCNAVDDPFDCCTGAAAGTCTTTGQDLLFICLLSTDNNLRMKNILGGGNPP